MIESEELYNSFIENSEKAFAGRLFSAAYHGLSAAMCCAVALQDVSKLREVESLAREQHEQLRGSYCESPPSKEPVELSLYLSLLQIVRTRIILKSSDMPRK